MSSAIIFWSWGPDDREYPVKITDVAEGLTVCPEQIRQVFRKWREEGKPKITRMEIEPKKWLEIYMYEDIAGWLSLGRPWGKGWRNLNQGYMNFTLEVSA